MRRKRARRRRLRKSHKDLGEDREFYVMMFVNLIKENQHFKKLTIRILILLTSVIIVVLLICGGQILINRLSRKQKEVQHEILRRERALLNRIQVTLLDAGYQQSLKDTQLINNPVLIVEVTNISPEVLDTIRLVAYFKKERGDNLPR